METVQRCGYDIDLPYLSVRAQLTLEAVLRDGGDGHGRALQLGGGGSV